MTLAAATNDDDVLSVFLEYNVNDVAITSRLLAENLEQTTFQALLTSKPAEMKDAAPDALLTATSFAIDRRDAINNLLQLCPMDWFQPTEDLLLTKTQGCHYAELDSILAYMRRVAGNTPITQKVLECMASCGQNMALRMLEAAKTWNTNLSLTQATAEAAAAAGNVYIGPYLAAKGASHITIDESWYRLAQFRKEVRIGSYETMRLIWENGEVIPDVADGNGMTALHHAANRDFLLGHNDATAEFVINAMAPNVNAADRLGWTPLQYVVRSMGDYTHAIQVLLDAGADPSKVDLKGQSAISVAELYAPTGFRDRILALLKGEEIRPKFWLGDSREGSTSSSLVAEYNGSASDEERAARTL